MLSDAVLTRCSWANPQNPDLLAYHDREWGVPERDDRALFELLALEGFQAGLSWALILAKRDAFREAFQNFDAAIVAAFDEARVEALMENKHIVRNRRKIEATIRNARGVLSIAEEYGTFAQFVWRFVEGAPRRNRPRTPADVPPSSPDSDALGAALYARGFRYVGSTIVYAFMQAAGLVDDHLTGCFRAVTH